MIHERFHWVADLMEVDPSDNILEIGCGSGILAELIGSKLGKGKIVAIDRSEAMVKMAIKRNQELISEGKVFVLENDFLKTTFQKGEFSKIVAFNVSFFWTDPEKELKLIRNYLAVKGKLFICHQPPNEITGEVAEKTIKILQKYQFKIINIQTRDFEPASAFCIIAGI